MVSDDEYSSTLHEEKATKPQQVQKLRMRGHRRTASNVLPYVKEKEPVHHQHATLPPSHPPSFKQKPMPKYPRRPGSTRPDQGVVTTLCPVLPAATAIKNFDRRNRCLIA